jgi:hypothetical protein
MYSATIIGKTRLSACATTATRRASASRRISVVGMPSMRTPPAMGGV